MQTPSASSWLLSLATPYPAAEEEGQGSLHRRLPEVQPEVAKESGYLELLKNDNPLLKDILLPWNLGEGWEIY